MNAEQMILLSQKLVMLSLANDPADKNRLTKEIAALNAELTESAGSNEKTVYCRLLKFTDKEISKMPKTFRKEFRVEGCTAHVRKRCDDRYRCSYEIRYRRNGYNVTASATTLEEAKQKFIDKLHQADKQDKITTTTGERAPTMFNEFAFFWFEQYHKRKVTEQTYKKNLNRFKHVIEPRFGNTNLSDVTAKNVQKVLDDYSSQGKEKTVREIHSLFKQIFEYAIRYRLIKYSPTDIVFQDYSRGNVKHGKALTFDEEKKLLTESAGTPYQLMFAVGLYTGLRPNDYYTFQIKGNMIIAKNSKRKNGEISFKRIPILKMLKPYLEGVDEIRWHVANRIREKFTSILPNHKLYDLRTTFYTRCEMFGVAEAAKNEMVGHSGGVLRNTYTDLPDDYLIKEAEKLVW